MTNRDGGDDVLATASTCEKLVTVVTHCHTVCLNRFLPKGDFASSVISTGLVMNVIIVQQPSGTDAQPKGEDIRLAVRV